MIEWADGFDWLPDAGRIAAVAITELALGDPVELARIAAVAGLPLSEAAELLHASPAEFDEPGQLIGFGLTLRPTLHQFHVDGRDLYTWCAPDALVFPVLLGRPARVQSPCFTTGTIVSVEVAPDGVSAVDPAGAVISIVSPKIELSDFRQRLCGEQHFFSSAHAAAGWLAERPDATVVPVGDAFSLTRSVAAQWLGLDSLPALGDGFDAALASVPRCALDATGASEQKARYELLAASVAGVRREPEAMMIEFDETVDVDTVERVIHTERECCPFLQFAFDVRSRRLRVSVGDPAMLPALDAIGHGFATAEQLSRHEPQRPEVNE
ncbi:MAG: organomercurial lyase MerB [Solirubrobacteraceae bacterium]